jgi:hypothetical protein
LVSCMAVRCIGTNWTKSWSQRRLVEPMAAAIPYQVKQAVNMDQGCVDCVVDASNEPIRVPDIVWVVPGRGKHHKHEGVSLTVTPSR